MIQLDLITPAADFPVLSPASQLLIQARRLERQASALARRATIMSACHLAEAAVHTNQQVIDLIDRAELLRAQAKRAQR